MSGRNLVVLALNVFGLLILINHVSSSDYSALLSRLYKRAAASDRPLIVLIDSNLLHSVRHPIKRPNHMFHAIGYNRLADRRPLPNSLIPKQKKTLSKPYKIHKIYDLEKKLHHSLLPGQKRVPRNKDILRSPIIRNLLRISNDLECEAKNECEDECNDNNKGNNNNCVDVCETKFDCEEEKAESGCDNDDTQDCETENAQGSTKGYSSTDPPEGCPQC